MIFRSFVSYLMMSFITLFNFISIVLSLRYHSIDCTKGGQTDTKHYSGESKQVLEILKDMQSDASHHNPYHHYGRHSGIVSENQLIFQQIIGSALGPATHEGHNSGHNNWDNGDKLWETGAGAHHSDYDKYGNQGYKQHYYDLGDGYHDRLNDGLQTGNFEVCPLITTFS